MACGWPSVSRGEAGLTPSSRPDQEGKMHCVSSRSKRTPATSRGARVSRALARVVGMGAQPIEDIIRVEFGFHSPAIKFLPVE